MVDEAVLASKSAAVTGVIDYTRIHAIASTDLDDLLAFCRVLAEGARDAR